MCVCVFVVLGIDTTAAVRPVHISLAAIISIVVVGLFVIIVTLASVAAGIFIWQHLKTKQ